MLRNIFGSVLLSHRAFSIKLSLTQPRRLLHAISQLPQDADAKKPEAQPELPNEKSTFMRRIKEAADRRDVTGALQVKSISSCISINVKDP